MPVKGNPNKIDMPGKEVSRDWMDGPPEEPGIDWGRVMIGLAGAAVGAYIANQHKGRITIKLEPPKKNKKRKRYKKTKMKPQTQLGKRRMGTILNADGKKIKIGGLQEWQVK